MEKSVIVIGGGMAGLSTGAYLKMNDYDVTIFELNDTPGGLCTSWKRGNYLVDLCIHWLVGSGPKNSFYSRWNELIEIDKIQFVNHDEFMRFEDENGNHISIFTNLDKLEAEFLEKAPEDSEEIRDFIKTVRKLSNFEMKNDKAPELANIWDKMKMFWKMLPYMGPFGKYMKLSCEEYSKRFKNPLLRKAIANLFLPDVSIIFGMITLTWLNNKTAGYPLGGSLNFARKVYDHFLALGGRMNFNSRVTKILVENDEAIGIELDTGAQHFADYVISAADGYQTIFEMLEGKYTDQKLRAFYKDTKTFPSLIFIALGINREFPGLPRMINFPIRKDLKIDPETVLDELNIHIHDYDPNLAPHGHTLITIMLETYNFDYWNKLYKNDRDKYESEKKRIAKEVIDHMENRFGNVAEKVEMIDVSTPVSFFQFTHNWKGSFEGWLITPENGFKHLSHTLPGLKNFYMCGQWVAIGGGLPNVVMSGRDTAQIICHEDRKPFKVFPEVALSF